MRAARAAGLNVTSLEIAPDGTIRVFSDSHTFESGNVEAVQPNVSLNVARASYSDFGSRKVYFSDAKRTEILQKGAGGSPTVRVQGVRYRDALRFLIREDDGEGGWIPRSSMLKGIGASILAKLCELGVAESATEGSVRPTLEGWKVVAGWEGKKTPEESSSRRLPRVRSGCGNG